MITVQQFDCSQLCDFTDNLLSWWCASYGIFFFFFLLWKYRMGFVNWHHRNKICFEHVTPNMLNFFFNLCMSAWKNDTAHQLIEVHWRTDRIFQLIGKKVLIVEATKTKSKEFKNRQGRALFILTKQIVPSMIASAGGDGIS